MKNAILTLALLGAALPAVAADKRVEEAVARAESQLQKGKPEEALKIMQRVVGQVPGPEAQAALARIQDRAGMTEEAAATAAKAVEGAGSAPAEARADALATLALLDLKRGSGANALKHAQEAAQLQPSASSLATLARAHARTQNGTAALEAADKAVQAGATSALAHVARAEALLALGRAADAAAAARKAIELDAASGAAHVQLASALIAQGKGAEAEAAARKATELDPKSGEAFAVLGSAILAADPQKWGDAIAQAQQGAFLNARNPIVQVQVGRIFEAGNNVDQALASYRRALEADPGYVAGRLALLRMQVRQGKVDEALVEARKMAAEAPESGEAQLQLGTLLLRKQDFAGGAEALARAAQYSPNSAEAHALLGVAYLNTRKPAEALAAYKRAVELDARNVDYRTTYGILLGINRQHDAGVAELKKVIETPGYKRADAYLNLGWLYRNMDPKRPEESVAAYKKALELDAKNEQAALGMGWAYSYLKNWDESIAAFNKAMELDPELAGDANSGIAWAYFFKKDLAKAEEFVNKAKAAGRNDTRLAENIDRVRKGLEAKEREPDEPAPAPRIAAVQDAGTLGIILRSGPLGARRKAARDLGKLGGTDAVSALIPGLRDGDLSVRLATAQALGSIGPAAKPAIPFLLRAADERPPVDPTAQGVKNEQLFEEFRRAVREAVGRIQ